MTTEVSAVAHVATDWTQRNAITSFCLEHRQLETLAWMCSHSSEGDSWFSALLLHIIQHVPAECLPCVRYYARCGRAAVNRQRWSLPLRLNRVVVQEAKLCFLPPYSLAPFYLSFHPSVPCILPEVCIPRRKLQEEWCLFQGMNPQGQDIIIWLGGILWWMSILWPLQIHNPESLACDEIWTMYSYCCSLESTWRQAQEGCPRVPRTAELERDLQVCKSAVHFVISK